tara:strand:- start:676 stop:1170 length:495 start_codon:yes stop_codon:yes gene_type:complete
MKKIIFLISFPLLLSSGHSEILPKLKLPVLQPQVIEQPMIVLPQPVDKLVNALIYVESRGNDSAIGDTHLETPSIGVLQIRPVMVREVNRILKIMGSTQRYKLKDRFNRQSSIEMFLFWKNYHHPKDGFEEIARCWNGGPRGLKNRRTEKYWIKVQKQLNINEI